MLKGSSPYLPVGVTAAPSNPRGQAFVMSASNDIYAMCVSLLQVMVRPFDCLDLEQADLKLDPKPVTRVIGNVMPAAAASSSPNADDGGIAKWLPDGELTGRQWYLEEDEARGLKAGHQGFHIVSLVMALLAQLDSEPSQSSTSILHPVFLERGDAAAAKALHFVRRLVSSGCCLHAARRTMSIIITEPKTLIQLAEEAPLEFKGNDLNNIV